MKSTNVRRTKFEQQFEDSQANYSEVNEGNAETRENNGKPIQLIRINQYGKIEVNEDALNTIAEYNSPVGFVSLVGKMRTGKSCLLNRVLQLTGKGFQVDPSVSSCTQGIWMWSEPMFNAAQNNYVFFLDTQGTDSLEKDVENDTKIFTLSLLIASYFIYNSVGSIDQRSLSELEMITALSKTIKADAKLSDRDNQEALHRFMPKFLWILRDFTLKIEDQKGRKISPTQYLQNCLSEQNNGQRTNDDSRKIKKSIMSYFKDRECVTLVRPIGDQIELQRLNNIPDHALRREFVEGINSLREVILRNAGPKTYEGEAITGPEIATMIQSYVQAFNSDKAPNIKSAWQQIAEDEGSAAFNRALQKYEEVFKDEFPNDMAKRDDIYKIVARLRDQTLKEFELHSYGHVNQGYLKNLKDLLDEKQQKIIEIHNNVREIKNQEILQKHAQKLNNKLESGRYNGKKEEFSNDINQMVRLYNAEARGEKKGDILTEFISSLTPLMLSLEQSESAEQVEQKRLDKIKLDEYQKQSRLQKEQIQSMKRQLEAAKDVSKVKSIPPTKSEISKSKDKKESSGGCCSGDKCQIM